MNEALNTQLIAKLTNPVVISFYLSFVFLLGSLASSAITVRPGGETFVGATMAVCLVGTVVFAVLAALLSRRARRGLDYGVFSSQSLRIGYTLLALIITVILFVVAGA